MTSSKCPHCNKEISVPGYATGNAETYRNSVTVVTLCCNRMVTITPKTIFYIRKYEGTRTEDDWGVEAN